MHPLHPATLLLTISNALSAYGGSTPLGGPCSPTNDHLDGDTFRSLSDCDARTYCLASNAQSNGTCVPRGCRRDEYPLAWKSRDPDLPPLCGAGTYCPDSGSGCLPQRGVGEGCEMDRDEQCASGGVEGTGSGESICLAFVCTYANVGVGETCTIDQVTYTDTSTNASFTTRRDNCRTANPALYCESENMTCKPVKPHGEACEFNRECASQFCQLGSVCTDPPETPIRIQGWQYVLTIVTMIAALAATCVLLSLVHRRHHQQHQRTVAEYYYQQSDLRRSLVAIQLAASRKRMT